MNKQIILTEEQVSQVEELSAYLNFNQIGDYLDFAKNDFNNLKKCDPRLLRAYKRGKAQGIIKVARKLRTLIDQGDVTAAIFYLKVRGSWSSKYRKKEKIKISFADTSPEGIFNSGFNALKNGLINLTQMEQIGNLALMKMKIESNELQKSSTGLLEQGMLYNIPKVKMN